MPRLRSIPLRLALIVPFLGLFAIAAALIAAGAQRNADAAGRTLGEAFAREVAGRIEAHVAQQLAPMPRLVAVNADALRHGVLDTADPGAYAPILVGQIRQYPQLTFVSVGLADGRYLSAARNPDGDSAPTLAENYLLGPGRLAERLTTPAGGLGEAIGEQFDYDPRERPFMQLVADADGPRWTPPNPYVGYASLGVGLSAPVRDANGALVGVAAIGLALEEVERFVDALDLPAGGIAFVAEPDGRLIATSGPAPAVLEREGGMTRRAMAQDPHPALQAAALHLDGAGAAEGGTVLAVGDAPHLLAWRTLRLEHGLVWTIGVTLPEAAYTAPAGRSARQTLGLLALTLLAIAAVGWWLARLIATPIERITLAAASRDLRGIALAPPMRSPIREVGDLALRLHGLAAELRRTLDDLEARVEQRTADLVAANAELQRLNTLDALTGIANRRSFDEALEREWQRGVRAGQPLSVLLVDIDHFKSFNDHYGHPAGDHALREVAGALHATPRRPADVVARYGGEEFALVLPDTDEDGARAVAASVQAAIARLDLRRDDVPGQRRLTLSIGVASVLPRAGAAPADLVGRADAQLYAAKAAGRDCVMPGGPAAARRGGP